MSKYTIEQVEACILAYRNGDLNYCRAGIIDLLTAYAATLKAAQGGVSEAMYRGAVQAWIDRAELDFPARLLAALEAALSAEPAAQGEAVALNVRHPKCHEAANAFWNYWNANGETHKRGYYESTWGAINAALRMVGVRPHDYGDAPPPDGSSPRYDDAAPPAQPADSKVIGDDSQIKPGERVPEGWALVPREALGYVSDLLAERKYGSAGRSPAHNARVVVDYWLTATPAAPAEEGDGKEGDSEDPPTCPICDQMKLSKRCSACGYEDPTTGAAR